ncbi:AGAP009835-PA-like protein [Anopheles sinensis]|uniref:AGAP009835-PA-like protein n=1 Tax=Anopheles sinensis TaxID=74873 RepID=A0A084W8U0_ANOSI|nr:AGAP009835-PA-like protein [Anopheles sinensis]
MASFACSLSFALGALVAAREMHVLLLRYVLRWPMEMFDTTPLGRVLNRFSKDVDVLDNTLPQVLRSCLMMLFGLFVFINLLSTLLATLFLYIGALEASKTLHKTLLRCVIRAPLSSFFDVTPIGRILNRFSQDVETVDSELPSTLRAWMLVVGSLRATRVLHRVLLAGVLRSGMTFFDTTPRGRIIARFSNDINTLDYNLPMNIKNFIPTVLRVCIARVAFDVTLFLGCWAAAVRVHELLLSNVLHIPMEFFDTTPIGRILQRFSKDVDVLDTKLPELLCDWVICALEVRVEHTRGVVPCHGSGKGAADDGGLSVSSFF